MVKQHVMAPKSNPAGFLRVSGTDIVDEKGNVVILKGVRVSLMKVRQDINGYVSAPPVAIRTWKTSSLGFQATSRKSGLL